LTTPPATTAKTPHHPVAIAKTPTSPTPTVTPATTPPPPALTTATATSTATQPAAPTNGSLDAGHFATLYQSVNAELKALEQTKGSDAAKSLWNRFRVILFSDAISSQDKRDQAAIILRQLHADVAKLR
jgi:hypothetical protein